jgi:outer membrane protein
VLRITVHEDKTNWRLRLEGKLADPWAREATSTWTSAHLDGRTVEVDLTDVTAVDGEGWALLRAMRQAGARLIVKGVEMEALVGEMHRTGSCTRSWSKVRNLLGVVAIAFGLMPTVAIAQDAQAPLRLTLRDAVSIALQQNPEVAIANLNLARSEQDRRVARADLLPNISVGATEQVTRSNTVAFFGKPVAGFPGHVGPFWTIDAGPQLSAPVFDLTAWRRWQAAGSEVRAATADVTTAREQNVELVVSQYLGGLRAAADVDAGRSRLDLAKALLDLATDLQRNGAGTSIDTLRANVEYQNERQRLAQAQTALKVSLYGLSRLLNVDPQRTLELTDQASFFDTPEVSADDSVTRAYRDRPELKSIAAQIEAASFERRAARADRLPKLTVAGRWSMQGLTPASAIPVYAYQASVEMPLFTGGRIGAGVAIADIQAKRLSQVQTDVRNRIALEVKSAVAQLESARTEVDAARLGVNLATENVRQAQDRFRAGVANNIEVITAQDELARANDNQITALYRYNQSRADLAHATGQMESVYSR